MVDFYAGEQEVIFSVGLLLPKGQEREVIHISQEIAKSESVRFQLTAEKRPPFVRLYEFLMPAHNTKKAFLATEHIAADVIPFRLAWGEREQTETFEAIWVEQSEPLTLLQRALLLALNPLREGAIKPKYQSEDSQAYLSSEERSSILTWGSPWADPYIPHMTIAKAVTKFTTAVDFDWPFEHCVVRGMVFGTKKEDGEFTDLHTIEFPTGE